MRGAVFASLSLSGQFRLDRLKVSRCGSRRFAVIYRVWEFNGLDYGFAGCPEDKKAGLDLRVSIPVLGSELISTKVPKGHLRLQKRCCLRALCSVPGESRDEESGAESVIVVAGIRMC